MSPESKTFLAVKAAVDALPAGQKDRVYNLAMQLRNTVTSGGGEGMMALALVGAQVTMENQNVPVSASSH